MKKQQKEKETLYETNKRKQLLREQDKFCYVTNIHTHIDTYTSSIFLRGQLVYSFVSSFDKEVTIKKRNKKITNKILSLLTLVIFGIPPVSLSGLTHTSMPSYFALVL